MTALVPRRYQHELFEQCLQRNTIICADTGVGKTLVACMLMRHLASLPSKPSGRLFAFLVPTVALVDQQSATVESQLPLRVVKFSSAQGIDFWQPDQWLQEIKKADVMVLTPAVLLKMLEHGYIAISQLDLVIFDEAHHARKNHPYKSILETYHREKLRSPTLQLPRIMGMTASPIFSARNAQIDIKCVCLSYFPNHHGGAE